MKNSPAHRPQLRWAFTLIELLVVISIIAILAALLLPTLGRARTRAKVAQAQTEMASLVQAIEGYYSHYSRYPVSASTMNYALKNDPNFKNDFTYGGVIYDRSGLPSTIQTPGGSPYNLDTPGLVLTNDEVISILMDLTNYPFAGGPTPTVNAGHAKNPEQIKFLNVKMVEDMTDNHPHMPGVGPDLVYRDPWGNPYIISLDLNGDEKCLDSVYRSHNFSQVSLGQPAGYNSLYNSQILPDTDFYEYNGPVMVWSAGPDMQVHFNNPGSVPPGPILNGKATVGANKDNVLSWK